MFERREADFDRHAQETGIFRCAACGAALFPANKRFDSGTGFPSFWAAIDENVEQRQLTTYGRERTQLVCTSCGTHLGHLFEDERTPSGVRFCIREGSYQ